MRTIVTDNFEKATDKLKNRCVEERILDALVQVQEAASIQDIRNLEKLSGFKVYYRIRVGDYRIGLKIEHNVVTFLDVGHRKEIYKHFP